MDAPQRADAEERSRSTAVRSVRRRGSTCSKAAEGGGWAELAEAGLLGAAVPEAHGGEGLGLRRGRRAAARDRRPRRSTCRSGRRSAAASSTLAAAGTEEQQRALLPGVAAGEVAADAGAARGRPPRSAPPPTTTYADGTVTGRKIGVDLRRPARRRLLVTAGATATSRSWRWSTPSDPGVTLLESGSSRGCTTHTVVLDGAAGRAARPTDAAQALAERYVAGLLPHRRRASSPALATSPPTTSRAGPSSAASLARVPGGRDADRRRLHRLAHPRPRRRERRLAARPRARRRPTTSPWRRTGPAPRRRRRCAPATTCTAAWASTRPTRCTTTSRWVTDIAHALDVPRRGGAGRGPDHQEPRAHRRPSGRSRPSSATYFTGLADHNEHREMGLDRHGEVYQRVVRQMGADGWMGVGWPKEYGGHGLGEIEQTIFANEAQYADVHLPGGDPADRRPDADPLRHREAEGPVPQADPGRRRALRDRLLRAGRRHRPRLAAHHGQARRRPLRRQRPEAVDHRRPPGRLRLARGPHRPGRPQAQGHLDPHRRHHRPRLLLHADHHRRRLAPRQRDLLQRRAGARRHAGRRGEPGLEADHHPAQPRAGDARPGRPDRGAARPGRRVGDQGGRRRPARRARACWAR